MSPKFLVTTWIVAPLVAAQAFATLVTAAARSESVQITMFGPAMLDAPADEAPSGSDTDPDESAWNTAIEAAPWVLGSSEPEREIPPEELFEKLEPFKRLVAEDIRHGDEDD